MPVIEVVRGSLLDQDVEAIVNAANSAMRGGGGIDGAIHRAAGRGLLEELERLAPNGCRTGHVVATGGHRLPFRAILHTPGPIWRGGKNKEEEQLANCYRSATLKAEELGIKTLGFCSISTGIYRFPLELAAPIALRTVRENAVNLERIVFAMFGEQEYEVFRNAAEQ